MEVDIYKQAFEKPYSTLKVTLKDGEYQKIECLECKGTGIFEITETDNQTCVDCKGSGYQWFNVY